MTRITGTAARKGRAELGEPRLRPAPLAENVVMREPIGAGIAMGRSAGGAADGGAGVKARDELREKRPGDLCGGRASAIEPHSLARLTPRPRRRGAGVVDRDGLENRCACKRTVGSNPTLSAI